MPVGKIFRSTESHPSLDAGRIIVRSSEECRKLDAQETLNEYWEEVGLAWSGPTGYGSLPRGFITTAYGLMVNVADDIRGTVLDNSVALGYDSEDQFKPVVTMLFKSVEDVENLADLLDIVREKLCSGSEG